MLEDRRYTILSFVRFGITSALITGVVLTLITTFVLGMLTSGSSDTVTNILLYGFFLCIVPSILIGAINGYFAGVITWRQDDLDDHEFMYELKIYGVGCGVAFVLCVVVFALAVILDHVKMGYLPLIAFGQIVLTSLISSAMMSRWHLTKPRPSPAPEPFDRRGEPLP